MKPFTQKHFGSKGTSTDDSHSFTKAGAAVMKNCAVYSYGSSPVKQSYSAKGPTRAGQGPEESREDYGKRVYKNAMDKIKAQKESSARRKKEAAQDQRSSIKVSMGLGTGRTSGKIKLPKVTSGMGTSYTTHKTKI